MAEKSTSDALRSAFVRQRLPPIRVGHIRASTVFNSSPMHDGLFAVAVGLRHEVDCAFSDPGLVQCSMIRMNRLSAPLETADIDKEDTSPAESNLSSCPSH